MPSGPGWQRGGCLQVTNRQPHLLSVLTHTEKPFSLTASSVKRCARSRHVIVLKNSFDLNTRSNQKTFVHHGTIVLNISEMLGYSDAVCTRSCWCDLNLLLYSLCARSPYIQTDALAQNPESESLFVLRQLVQNPILPGAVQVQLPKQSSCCF